MIKVCCFSEHLITQESRTSPTALGQFDDPNGDDLPGACGISGQVQCLADLVKCQGHGADILGVEGALVS